MNFQQRVSALVQLGKRLASWAAENHPCIHNAYIHNSWHTEENVKKALDSWALQLHEEKLNNWLGAYPLKEAEPKFIAIIMAGNIPLVGLHDLLSVLVCGHKAIVKLSNDDKILMKEVILALKEIEPGFTTRIEILEDRLPKTYDAVIATGSNNTNRYFEYYFKEKPHLFRKNRSSVAVLTGNETPEDLEKLGGDIFTYFGLGCRNVSKLYVPRGYDFTTFFESTVSYRHIIDHNKYANNYTYHSAIFLMNLTPYLDSGFMILKHDEAISSPLSCVFYEEYDSMNALQSSLNERKEEIQCVVGKTMPYIPFGKAQTPELWDYADGVDTIAFLQAL